MATIYSTTFPLTENPISENGIWHHTDSDQTPCQTLSGICFGTQTGAIPPPYTDSTAFLTDFGPNQRVTAIIHKTGASPNFLEFEVLLRWSEGAEKSTSFGNTRSYGYEINCNSEGAYVQIGQFKGVNLFNSLNSGSFVTTSGIHNGDIYTVEIIGLTITAYLTRPGSFGRTVIAQATDVAANHPFLSGGPGIGFFRQDSGGTIDPKACCFSSVTLETIVAPSIVSAVSA